MSSTGSGRQTKTVNGQRSRRRVSLVDSRALTRAIDAVDRGKNRSQGREQLDRMVVVD